MKQEQAREQPKKDFKYIVRLANTDVDGKKPILNGLRKVKGVSYSVANFVCNETKVERTTRTGELSSEEIAKLEAALKNLRQSLPVWMRNRRKDFETGEDLHLLGPSLDFAHESDIRNMKKIRCYRGMRHAFGLPVRGQRTRSNFRKNKGRGPGVKKKANIGKT